MGYKLLEGIPTKPEIDKQIVSQILTKELIKYDLFIDDWLDNRLLGNGLITEPALARLLPRLLPDFYPCDACFK